MTRTILLLSALMMTTGMMAKRLPVATTSPNGRIELTINSDKNRQLTYTVKADRQTVVKTSLLGLVMDGKQIGQGARLVEVSPVSHIHEAYTLKSGKRTSTVNDCNAQTFSFRTPTDQRFDIEARVFDDGVAFRYVIEPQIKSSADTHTINSELTEFAVNPEGRAWIFPYDWNSRHKPSYEQYCRDSIAIGLSNDQNRGWAFPMLFNTAGHWLLITEACLDGTYPATHIDNSGTNGTYRIRFPEADEPVVADEPEPRSVLPWHTPWRTIIVGQDLNTIFRSQIVQHLNPACAIADTTWIRPGRSCWSWWYSGGTVTDFPTQLRYADLSHEMTWEYMLIDASWQKMKNGGRMEDVVPYAADKNVGVWLWYHSGAGKTAADSQWEQIMSDPQKRRAEMERISQLGVKGIKVDFFDTDKQPIIKLYPAILRDAAACHLMVDFHGATLPRGLERTYPNLMTTEAVRGAEGFGMQERCDRAAWHATILPLTRNVVGSMDFTPVTFSNKIRRGVTAYRRTSMAHQLALAVVFESGFQCFADRAEAYLALPADAKDFLKNVPTAWDDSQLLSGYPGNHIVVARQKGNRMYIAGINGKAEPRTLTVKMPANCVGKPMRLIADGADIDHFADTKQDLCPSTQQVNVLPNGGFAMTVDL